MGFGMVIRSLRDVFPQIDLRILKSVAIEYSEDVDAAAEFVISDVLPYLNELTEAPYMLDDTHGMENSPAEVGVQDRNHFTESTEAFKSNPYTNDASSNSDVSSHDPNEKNLNVEEDEPNLLLHRLAEKNMISSLASEPTSRDCGTKDDADHTSDSFHVESCLFNDTVPSTSSNAYVNNLPLMSSSNMNVNELVSNEDIDEEATSTEKIVPDKPVMITSGICYPAQDITPSQNKNSLIACEAPGARGLPMSDNIHVLRDLEINDTHYMTPSISGKTSNLEGGSLLDSSIHSYLSHFEEQYSRGTSENGSEPVALDTDMSYVAKKPTVVAKQSGSVVSMNILEDFISDVKSNKDSLVSTFESVSNMIKEVEFHEDRAKIAKEEASRAGQEILTEAEDRRQMLKHAKEENEKQAGEIYVEKSILGTEARELQSRLLNLSDEKENSHVIIEEIRRTLEARLAAAKEEETAAEEEKVVKEGVARKILREQELSMFEVVQEATWLQQEAEDNAKLREFLKDRGGVVDVLQGELAVVCQDILKFKERVDGHIHLIKSPSLTSCNSASSSSSGLNLTSFSQKNVHAVDSVVSPKSNANDDNGEIDAADSNNKAFSDDDWELYPERILQGI